MLTLSSPAFSPNCPIPRKYTCEGANISPPLAWQGTPAGTQSLVLVMDDPDAPDPEAPRMVWVHWVLYNLPAEATVLPEDVSNRGLPECADIGLNDYGRADYGGPCPPIGRHRYFHRLYALDSVLAKLRRPTKAQLLGAMQGHVLAEAELIGTYQKGQ